MTLHRKKPKMARASARCGDRYAMNVPSYTEELLRAWFACYRWHKAVKP